MMLKDAEFQVPTLDAYHVTTSSTFSPAGFTIGTDISVAENLAVNVNLKWQNADAPDELLVDST